ncbi:hypothetical protein J7L29_06640 [Candidatus Bathyarchaeota archaeon]|nr:hypothetical protein [Candidatus Bathyarchaeota archaeon]
MGQVLEVTVENWEEEVLNSDKLTSVDFWHKRCPWCIRLNPILEEISEEYKVRVKFVKLNVLETMENREIAI